MIANLLDSIYSGKSLLEFGDILKEFLAEIKENHVGPQIFYMLKQMDKLNELPYTVRHELESMFQATAGQSLLLKRYTQQVLAACDRALIPVIPLKGTVFAERFFGHCTARATSDIDLFVKPEDIERAIKCLRELGFSGPEEYNPIHFHSIMWKKVHPGLPALSVEIHWSLLQWNSAANPEWSEFWTDAKPFEPYTYVKQLSVLHTFYAICLHGANHKLESFKYILDVAHMIFCFGDEIDYNELFGICHQHKTVRRVKAVLSLTYKQFPSLMDKKTLPYRSLSREYKHRMVLGNRICVVDSWKTRIQLFREWLWPLRDVVAWYMRDDNQVTQSNLYFRFYRHRILKCLRLVVGNSRNTT